jgi:hypothetical protein
MAQAVVLPLEPGLTLRQLLPQSAFRRAGCASYGTALGGGSRAGEESPKQPRGRLRRERLTPGQEAAQAGGVWVVPPIEAALDSHLGRPVTLPTVYRMLHRQG